MNLIKDELIIDLNARGVTHTQVSPKIFLIRYRHIFGVSKDIKNALFLIDDTNLVYVAGHNIVMYRIDDQEQTFFPGMSVSFLNLNLTARFSCGENRGDHVYLDVQGRQVHLCVPPRN